MIPSAITLKKLVPILLVSCLLALAACQSGDDNNAITTDSTTLSKTDWDTTGDAPTGKSWVYQLQNASITELADTSFDVVTMDYSSDGTEATRYTSSQIASLQSEGKVVLAYLSIGEAEDYRYYFDSDWVSPTGENGLNQPNDNAPGWLGLSNQDWEGNYKVQYWAEGWQTIITGYLDKIIAAGFDGVYLDIIDAYLYWSDPDNGEDVVVSESEAAADMIAFVKKLAYHARITKGLSHFYIFPQNAEEILDYDSDVSYLNAISGIGTEDLFYNETDAIDSESSQYRMNYLGQIKDAGKLVIVVDYVDDGTGYSGTNQTRIDDFYNQVTSNGYLAYAAIDDRDLDEINIISGLQE